MHLLCPMAVTCPWALGQDVEAMVVISSSGCFERDPTQVHGLPGKGDGRHM